MRERAGRPRPGYRSSPSGGGLSASIVLMLALLTTVPPQATASQSTADAVRFLDHYSVGFTLHYLCGSNPLAAASFDHTPPAQLSQQQAATLSPALMNLSAHLNHNPPLLREICERRSSFNRFFEPRELSDAVIDGLWQLGTSGVEAFETGVYYRIRGYEPNFEHYVWQLFDELSVSRWITGIRAPP